LSGQDAKEFIKSYLLARGCSDAVVRGGVPYLVERWEEIVAVIERGYDGELDDYLNDMDVRQILADVRAHHVMTAFEPGSEFDADGRLRRQLVPARGCLWGRAAAELNGWTPEQNWWYFEYPRHPGDALFEDLARRHLLRFDGHDHSSDTR
jgi:hypothetical protein